MAVGSCSVWRTCSNQVENWRKGSASERTSSRASPRYSRRMSARDMNLVVLNTDANDGAVAEFPEEQPLGQRLLDDALDQPRHGPGAEGAIETLGGEPCARGRVQFDTY